MDDKDKKYAEIIAQSVKSIAEGKFALNKVVPADAELRIGEKVYKVGRFTLRAKKYFIDKYGVKDFVIYLNEQMEIASAEVIHHLIDANGKKDFPTFEQFLDVFTSSSDDIQRVIATFNSIMGFANQSGATDAEALENTDEKKT